MSVIKKLDQIPPPYSTILALLVCAGFGAYFLFFDPREELRPLGLGIIIGAIIALLCKKVFEISDRELLLSLTGKTNPKKDDKG